jgi:hypothetical protein
MIGAYNRFGSLLLTSLLLVGCCAFLTTHPIGTSLASSGLYASDAKSVNESTNPRKLIRRTDYLSKNPRPTTEAPKEAENIPPTLSLTEDELKRYNQLLEEALTSFDSSSAKKISQDIASMRNSGTEQKVMNQLLGRLLSDGPDARLPFWSRFRFLSRYSRRARLSSLRRTLTLTTPPPSVEDEVEDTPEDQQRRRRRALLSLLRILADSTDEASSDSVPAITSLEKRAKKDRNSKPSGDMRSRLPVDLETPQYDVVIERSGYEIRRYDAFSICSVSMSEGRPVDAYKTDAVVSDPKLGGARAFGALAGYLFGKNQESQPMSMTTPVINRGEMEDKTMSFVLPSEFWKDGGLSLAPQPLEGSGVTLELVESDERAIIMFGGYASKSEVDAKKRQLFEKLKHDKEWEAVEDDLAVLAQYNDPFTPPWKRLNEVSVAVRSRQ